MLNRDGQSVSAMDLQLPRCLFQNARSLSWPQRLPRGFVSNGKISVPLPLPPIKKKLFASCLFYWKDTELPGGCLWVVLKLSFPGLELVLRRRQTLEGASFWILNQAPFLFFHRIGVTWSERIDRVSGNENSSEEGTSLSYLESLVADFFAFLVPDNLGLRFAGSLAYKGGHAPLDSCLVLRCSREPRLCCVERERETHTHRSSHISDLDAAQHP